MKRLQRIVLLAHADELDGLARDLPNGKRRAAAGVAVHLGEDHAGERKLLVELVGGAHRILSGHGVGDEQNLGRIQQLLQRLHLVHELVVDVQTAGGIDDQHVAAGNDGLAARFFHQPFDACVSLRVAPRRLRLRKSAPSRPAPQLSTARAPRDGTRPPKPAADDARPS